MKYGGGIANIRVRVREWVIYSIDIIFHLNVV